MVCEWIHQKLSPLKKTKLSKKAQEKCTNWRQGPHRRTSLAHRKKTQNPPQDRLTEQQVKQGVLEGSIPSAAWDTSCTSHDGMLGDPFIQTEHRSTNIFAHPTPATNIAKLEHRFREPECTVNMVPALANQSLLSWGTFAEAGYVSVCDGCGINIYNVRTATITVSEDAVMKGWRCPRTKLWRIPLQAQVTDLKMHTLLLNGPMGRESLNSLYTVPTTASVLAHIEAFDSNQAAGETINNVYELPSPACAVRYLHAAAGFPTKETWLKSISNGNYITWPLLAIHNMNRHFP